MNKLLENSKVQLTTAIVVGVFVVGLVIADATWKVNISRDVKAISVELQERKIDRWHRGNMETWVLRTERMNPGWEGAAVEQVTTHP